MGSAAIRQEWEGRTLDGKFALLEELGGSRKGSVFLTLRQGAQRSAIRIVRAEGPIAEAHLARWETAKALSHPHLMQIFELGRATLDGAGVVYAVMEMAEADLLHRLREEALTPPTARDVFDPILDALSYIHAEGFIHGHVKPSNILLVDDVWKLASDDFVSVEDRPTRAELTAGVYDAPEILTGNLAEAADTWSLGMTLAEALTQLPPARDSGHSHEPRIPDSIPQPFLDIVRNCLRSNAAERWSLERIKRELASVPSRASAAFTMPHTPVPVPVPRPAGSIAAAAARKQMVTPDAPANSIVVETSAEPVPVVIDPIPAVPEPLSAAASDPSPASDPTPSPEPAAPAAIKIPFADYEEDDPHHSRFSVVPVLLALVVLLAFAGVLLERSNRLRLPWFQGTQSSAHPSLPPSPSPTGSAGSAAPSSAPAALPPSSRAQSGIASPTRPRPPAAQPHAEPSAPAPSSARTSKEDKSPSQRPLNTHGAVVDRPLPDVTQSARNSMRGPVEATVRISVDRTGAVKEVSYVSPGAGNYFARTAVRAAHAWRFAPPQRNGRALPSVWLVRFNFTKRSTEVTSTEEER